jgi:hypothetical protein
VVGVDHHRVGGEREVDLRRAHALERLEEGGLELEDAGLGAHRAAQLGAVALVGLARAVLHHAARGVEDDHDLRLDLG